MPLWNLGGDTMKVLFKQWRDFIKEGPQGTHLSRGNDMADPVITKWDDYKAKGEDIKASCKVVLHRNGKVLLLKSATGKHEGSWDLPGGHMKQDDLNAVSALKREVFEETGMTVYEPKDLSMRHQNKRFFVAAMPPGAEECKNNLSDEHSDVGLFTLDQVKQMSNSEISPHFKEAIIVAMEAGLE